MSCAPDILMKSARIFVSGLVQGVSYRAFACRHARGSGLRGFVRNLADGRVEVFIEGEEKDIHGFIKKLREGPRAASVEDTQISWEDYRGLYDSFEVLR